MGTPHSCHFMPALLLGLTGITSPAFSKDFSVKNDSASGNGTTLETLAIQNVLNEFQPRAHGFPDKFRLLVSDKINTRSSMIRTSISLALTWGLSSGTFCPAWIHNMKYFPLLGLLLTGSIHAAPGAVGAKVPFITHEAELQKTTGNIVNLKGKPSHIVSPEMEASGRSYVELNATGQGIVFPVTTDANTLVIRHCIPDAPEGGGSGATLSLFVNNRFSQEIKLSSRHNWLYGEVGQNGQTNTPGEAAHVFWEESRYSLKSPLKPGDQLDLRKRETDTAAFYRIDLIDLEQAPAPLPQPASSLSVTDFGANANDDKDDSDAIIACIKAAKERKQTVWIPAGKYHQSKRFELDGPIAVRGAGMWHTEIIGTTLGSDFASNMGFALKGDGPKVSDLYLECTAQTNRNKSNGRAFTGQPKNWSVENVWITHTQTGFWVSAADNGLVKNCRVRFTYADGINLNRGTSNTIVENCHVRGCGDDGIAILSETERKDPPARNNILRHNTSTAIWWGHNLDLAGGSNHLVENNLLADNALMGVFTINMTGAYPNHPLSDSIVRGNSLIRGGGNYAKQKRGAAWIYADSTHVTNVLFEQNLIANPIYCGIHITGRSEQKIIFKTNSILNPGENGIVIKQNVIGSAELIGNVIGDTPEGGQAIANSAPPGKFELLITKEKP